MWMCLCLCFHLLRNQGEWLSSIHSGREQQRELLEKKHKSHSVSSTADARRFCWRIQSQRNNVKENFIPDTLTKVQIQRPGMFLTVSHWKPVKDKGCCFFDLWTLMPAPRRFLVASTSMPLAVGWGWNICVYFGLLTLLLLLMGLLLWMVLKQLRNSVGNVAMQSGRSFRETHFGNCRSLRF